MGDWIFGCDICQEVCPHNSAREAPALPEAWREPHEAYEARAASFDLLEVLGWDEDARRDRVSGTPMTRAKLGMFRRNALIAAGNRVRDHGDGALRDTIERVAGDDAASPLVRATAERVLAGLSAEHERADDGDEDAGDEPER